MKTGEQFKRSRIAATVAVAWGRLAALAWATRSQAPPSLPAERRAVVLDPADFTTQITNPYFPLVPGSRLVYREQDAQGTLQKGVTHVTKRTRPIANGITARVVHDVVSEHGAPVEKTFDWYAQDSAGNVWYLGEDTKEYKNGQRGLDPWLVRGGRRRCPGRGDHARRAAGRE